MSRGLNLDKGLHRLVCREEYTLSLAGSCEKLVNIQNSLSLQQIVIHNGSTQVTSVLLTQSTDQTRSNHKWLLVLQDATECVCKCSENNQEPKRYQNPSNDFLSRVTFRVSVFESKENEVQANLGKCEILLKQCLFSFSRLSW
jgi:hypothetical protein